MVYENGRAYPEYLVRYYKGPRDPERTPYETLEDAVNGEKMRESSQELDGKHLGSAATTQPEDDMNSVSSVQGIWQFEDDKNDWGNYQEAHQVQIEEAYQRDPNGFTTIEHFPWTYVIDFGINTQTNLDHPDKTTRKVRRIHMDHNRDNHSQAESRRRGSHTDSHDGSRQGSHCGSPAGSPVGITTPTPTEAAVLVVPD